MTKLTKCKDCNHEISKKAKLCPNCGATNTYSPSKEQLKEFYAGAKKHPIKVSAFILALFIISIIPQGLVATMTTLGTVMFFYALLNVIYPFKKLGLNTRMDAWMLCCMLMFLAVVAMSQSTSNKSQDIKSRQTAQKQQTQAPSNRYFFALYIYGK